MSIPLTDAQKFGLGLMGTDHFNDVDNHTGEWWKVLPTEATVFTTLTDGLRGGDTLEGESIPANHEGLRGKITVIKLASGAVNAFRTGDVVTDA